MKTIVITSQKGGSGKTTLASHLAVAAELANNGPTALVDTDPQQTLVTWWNTREAETPQLAVVTLRELPEKLAVLAKAGFTYCFIDTPPALTEQNRQVLQSADLVLSRHHRVQTISGLLVQPWISLSNRKLHSSSFSHRLRRMPELRYKHSRHFLSMGKCFSPLFTTE